MIRSLVLKVPLALALAVALWLGPGSAAGLAALAVAGVFAALLAWQVFDVTRGCGCPPCGAPRAQAARWP
jgi:hypothetical protein